MNEHHGFGPVTQIEGGGCLTKQELSFGHDNFEKLFGSDKSKQLLKGDDNRQLKICV